MEEQNFLYHGSPAAGLKEIRPGEPRYFDKARQVCLTASLPMALLYGVKHFEYTYGYDRGGGLYYAEYFPDALREIYGGRSASLYRCLRREDMEPTDIPNEYVTPKSVPVAEEMLIPDVYEALLEQERLGALRIVRWPEVSPAFRARIAEMETRTILERDLLRKDGAFARYMRNKYPDSWALARAREKEQN